MMNTITVVSQVSFQLGQVTFDIASRRTSWRNCIGDVHDGRTTETLPRPSSTHRLFRHINHFLLFQHLAGAEGLEPTTLGFGDRCSTS